MRVTRVRRVAAFAVAGALLPLALTATPVAAANNTILSMTLGDCGAFGDRGGNRQVTKVVWRDSDGRLKSKHSVRSAADGTFQTACEFGELIESGDTFRLTKNGESVTIRVPRLTVNADRVTDLVWGKGPEDSLVTLVAGTYGTTFTLLDERAADVPTDGLGDYEGDFTGVVDLVGWDEVTAVWFDARGDAFARAIQVQGLQVWLNQPWVESVGNPRSDFVAEALAPSLNTLGVYADGYDFWGEASGTWLDEDGDSARPRGGGSIESDHAGDGSFELPDITASPNKSTDRVTGDCGPGGFGWRVDVYARDFTATRSRIGVTGAAGTFTARFDQAPRRDIRSGDKVDVSCKTDNGDIVARTFTVE